MDNCNFEPFFVVFKPSSGKVRAKAGAKAEDIGRELRLGVAMFNTYRWILRGGYDELGV